MDIRHLIGPIRKGGGLLNQARDLNPERRSADLITGGKLMVGSSHLSAFFWKVCIFIISLSLVIGVAYDMKTTSSVALISVLFGIVINPYLILNILEAFGYKHVGNSYWLGFTFFRLGSPKKAIHWLARNFEKS